MATASSMIFASLVMTGDKEIGGTITSAEQTYYLERLQVMLDSWQIERLMCYQVLQESFGLTASTASYTIGTNGVFATDRPTRIVDPCFVRDSSNVDAHLEIINVEAYGNIQVKSGSTGYPRYLYYDQGFSATSTATISIYPPPSASLTLFINSVKQLQSFGNITTVVNLPPGYQRAIETNFAVEIAGGFTRISPEVAKIAMESKAAIKSINLPSTIMTLDAGLAYGSRRGNIEEGP